MTKTKQNIEKMVTALINDDYSTAESSLRAALSYKVHQAIEKRRPNVAKSMFGETTG